MIPLNSLTQVPQPLIKVCGLTSPQDSISCAQLGVDWLGFIFHPPSPRYVSPSKVRAFETLGSRRVGVFVGQGAEEILAIMAEARLDLAQLHGEQSLLVARAIGAQRAIRVFWPERYGGRSDDWARDLELWSKEVAYFLFDAGLSGGGHGRQLDLQRSSPAGETWFSPRPYFLAGGLKPGDWPKLWPNDDPRLVGLDFNSGVEISPGVKDLLAIKALVAAREIGV